MKKTLLTFAVIAAVIAVTVLVVALANHGPGGTSPDKVATMTHADWCDDSGYYVETQLAGKQTVYDCTTGARQRCVTVHGGIASDSTVLVRVLFADTLSTTKPACLG